jgi:hypothetical protein
MTKKIPADFGDEELSEAPWDEMHTPSDHLAYMRAEESLRVRSCALDMAVSAMATITTLTEDKRDYGQKVTALAVEFETYLRTGKTQ